MDHNSEKGGFPSVPPSLQHEAFVPHEHQHNTSIRGAIRSSGPTPYLGLPSRLSQIWFNKWTVLLLLVLAHFLITIGSLNGSLGDAKEKALSACTKVEDIGSAMASMPHYLSVGVNSLAATGITESVQALMSVLNMIITGVEQLILFFIHMMTDTYVCLISMAIHGALNVSAVVVEKTTEGMNLAIDGIAGGLNDTAGDLQGAIDKAYDVINSIAPAASSVADSVQSGVEDFTSDAGSVADQVTSGVGQVTSLFDGIFPRTEDLPEPTATLMAASQQTIAIEPPLEPTATLAAQSTIATEVTLEPIATLAPHELMRRLDILEKPDILGPIRDAMDKLKNINIDTSGFVQGLNQLNDDLPTFDEIRNKTNEAVSIPFDLIRDKLNDAYGDYKFDENVFPVAQKEALSFCSENSAINDFFESLFTIARQAKITAIVVLIVLAILVCVPMAYLEIRQHKSHAVYSERFRQHAVDEMDTGYLWSRRYTGSAGIWLAGKANSKRPILIRWCIAYATSLPALFVLSLAIAGFFSCFCQMLLLKTIEKTVPELADQVGDFAEDVVYTLGNVSEKWATDANGVITSFSDEINQDVLGHVTDATTAVNETINTFTDTMNQGLTDVFGETAFRDAAAGVIRCVIGLKIETVQKGLTWVHDNAHVNFPMFPPDVYSMGASQSINGDSDLTTFLATPSSVTTDEITGAVLHVTNWLRNNIIQDALISLALLLVYIVVVLLGVMWTMYRYMTPERVRGDGGNQPADSYDFNHDNAGQKFGTVASGYAMTAPGHARQSSQAFYGDEKH